MPASQGRARTQAGLAQARRRRSRSETAKKCEEVKCRTCRHRYMHIAPSLAVNNFFTKSAAVLACSGAA
eukprot:4786560-Amphidinium_carterae.1